jgi:hypothetical protein
MEADLADPAVPRRLFADAEAALGPIEILVNNASSWLANTFLPEEHDRFGRILGPVDAERHDRQFAVDARASALLIAEFARGHLQRGASWGRIIGLTSGGSGGFPQEVSYGAAKAAQENYTMSAAQETGPLRRHRQHGLSTSDRHRLGHPRRRTSRRQSPAASRTPRRRRRGHHLAGLPPGPLHHRPDHPHGLNTTRPSPPTPAKAPPPALGAECTSAASTRR